MLDFLVSLLRSLWKALAPSLLSKISAWVFGAVGTIAGTIGYSQDDITYLVTGIVSIVVALLFDLFAHIKTYRTIPD